MSSQPPGRNRSAAWGTKPLDDARSMLTAFERRQWFKLSNVGRKLLHFCPSHIRRVAEDQIQRFAARVRLQQIALEEVDPVGYVVPLGILPCYGQGRLANVDGGHVGFRQMLGTTDRDDSAPRADVGNP